MVDLEDIQVRTSLESLSFPCENSAEDPERLSCEAQDETGSGVAEGTSTKRRGSAWQAALIVILMVLVCGVTGILFAQKTVHQSVLAQLQQIAGEMFTTENATDGLRAENTQLRQLLNSTSQNLTLLRGEHGQLRLLLSATMHDLAALAADKAQLSAHLKDALQERARLRAENGELGALLNATLESCSLAEEENRQLNLLLNESLHIITLASAENRRRRQQLVDERQTSARLADVNKRQRSILFSDNLSFLWRRCNASTLRCSRCLPGWVEHASRCFSLSRETQKWEVARQVCMGAGGDLAVVLDADDQAFLTNFTFLYVQEHPQENFHSAWIGLQDMVKEGVHFWVNGNRVKWNVIYWKHMEPNNAIASWDKHRSGQDCVAIVPPTSVGPKGWLNSWDDIVCAGKRHYICENAALVLS